MTISDLNPSENLSTYTLPSLPLVESRPHFEVALARINERNVVSNSEETVKAAPSDSFGSWFEWD